MSEANEVRVHRGRANDSERRSREGAKIHGILLTLSKSKTSFIEIKIAFLTL